MKSRSAYHDAEAGSHLRHQLRSQYTHSLRLAPERYEHTGFLARGSERSRQAAKRHEVPLYCQVEEIPTAVDFACAAMGRDGRDTMLQLLRHGKHVLCEHPLSAEPVERALAAADDANVRFHINGHFAQLEASSAFIRQARLLQENTSPCVLRVMVADRVPVRRGGHRAEGPCRGERLAVQTVSVERPFSTIVATAGDVQSIWQIQPSRRPDGTWIEEASGEYRISYRVELVYQPGVLSLTGVDGPVLWHANENVVSDCDAPLWKPVYVSESTNRSVGEQRVTANLRALDALVSHAEGGPAPPEQEPSYLRDVAANWETLGRAIQERE